MTIDDRCSRLEALAHLNDRRAHFVRLMRTYPAFAAQWQWAIDVLETAVERERTDPVPAGLR